MARKTNYGFERREREKKRADKRAERQRAKEERSEQRKLDPDDTDLEECWTRNCAEEQVQPAFPNLAWLTQIGCVSNNYSLDGQTILCDQILEVLDLYTGFVCGFSGQRRLWIKI